jgi:2-C-methyl-D-erythritol 4-phosphate cytidylyltransferase
MVEWSVAALREVEAVDEIVVALPPGESAPPETVGAPGGATRSESVRAALRAAGPGDPVIVHDAARPLATAELFERALAELEATGADGVVAAAQVTDTIKRADAEGRIVETPARAELWAVQTPQVFRRAVLEDALSDDSALVAATDDASLVEARGGDVRVVAAPADNIKVTAATDLQVADLLLRQRHHVAVVAEILEAVNTGRMEDPFAHYHDDVVWDLSANQLMPGEWDDVYLGHQGLRSYWSDWMSVWETVHFVVERVFAVGNHVVQFQRQRVRGRQSGVDLEFPTYAQVWTFRGDKVAAMRFFADTDEAVRFAQEN